MFPATVAPEPVLRFLVDKIFEMSCVAASYVAFGEAVRSVSEQSKVYAVASAAQFLDIVDEDRHVIFSGEMFSSE